MPMPSALRSGGGSLLSSVPGGAIGDPLSATNNDFPSGLRRIPRGRLPTGMVAVTFCDATSITEISPAFSLVTKRRPADPDTGAAAGTGAAGCADGGSLCEHPAARTEIAMQMKTALIAAPILLPRGQVGDGST